MIKTLIVDDEEDMLEVCRDILKRFPEIEVTTEREGPKAAERLRNESFELMITDLNMPKLSGIELVKMARAINPALMTLVITAFPTPETVIESVNKGVFDYLVKPFSPDQLMVAVRRVIQHKRLLHENEFLTRHLQQGYKFEGILGDSPSIRRVFDVIHQVAQTNSDVLVVGESGTGKELIARGIHAHSRRKDRRFVPVDCGAIPEPLMESELFGHEKGAYTGAHSAQMGLMEFADQGTLFLDELCEMPASMQSKLLRVLQERTFRRVGAQEERHLDVRIVAATNRDIDAEVKEKRFREDLYYRVNVVRIDVPPLRERSEDILPLADHFLKRFSQEFGRPMQRIEDDAMEVLRHYLWPGNIRELQNVIKRAVVLTKTENLKVDDLPFHVVNQTCCSEESVKDLAKGFFSARSQKVDLFEIEYLKNLLTQCNGDVTVAAQKAGFPRGTLYRFMKKHGLSPEAFRK